MEWRGREWSGVEWRGGQGRAGQGRVPDCLGGLSRVGISSRSTRPWNGQPPSTLNDNPHDASHHSQQTCLCWANVGPTFVVTLDQRRTPTLDQRCFAHWAYGGPNVGANHLPTVSQC